MKINDFTIEVFEVGPLQSNSILIYSKTTKNAISIDPGQESKKLLEKINSLNLNLKDIIHTHGHFDHAGASSDIQNKTNASLWIHKEDVPLYLELKEQTSYFGFNIPLPSRNYKTFEDGDCIKLDNIDLLKVLHTPGHTRGSSCFYIDDLISPILFSGDTLFYETVGRTDFKGGSFEQIIYSIKNKLYTLRDETQVVTGHGQFTTVGYEKMNNECVRL